MTIWGNSDSISNGFTFATGVNSRQINGIGIGLLGLVGDKMNGLFITGLMGTSNWSDAYNNKVNGVVIGGIFGVDAKELNGVSVGMINRTEKQNGVTVGFQNYTKELHGIQFGFFNTAENNKFIKKMLLINFNFRKKNRKIVETPK